MNLKKYYQTLLSGSSELVTLIGEGKIMSAYPQTVETFPLVVYEDQNSRDVEFSDNLPDGTAASVRVHIFTKTLTGYPTTTAIAEVVRDIFRADYWTLTANNETADVDDSIRHRVMDFTREFYSL